MIKFNIVLIILLNGAFALYGQTRDSLETKTDVTIRPRVNPPLYVISEEDRTFVYSDRNYTSNLNTDNILDKINHTWINSITVLKDKSATDMYGSMGQHGVVVINLKHGSLDKMPDDLVKKFKIK